MTLWGPGQQDIVKITTISKSIEKIMSSVSFISVKEQKGGGNVMGFLFELQFLW